MSSYHAFHFIADPEKTEIAIALLQELPFKGFEETAIGFEAYMVSSEMTDAIEQEIKALSDQLDITFQVSILGDRNWNQVWEAQFQPVVIDNRVAIRAEFHPHFPEVEYELNIHPKMAFGTGHHETTTMMIQEMLRLDFKDKKVLDYGCGTGILGIFASKRHAKQIVGVDNEYPAYESTIENSWINQVENMKPFFGTLNTIQDEGYDIILANINRNVILESLQSLVSKTSVGGTLLFSGVLASDKEIMEGAFQDQQLEINNLRTMGQWLCFKCSKKL